MKGNDLIDIHLYLSSLENNASLNRFLLNGSKITLDKKFAKFSLTSEDNYGQYCLKFEYEGFPTQYLWIFYNLVFHVFGPYQSQMLDQLNHWLDGLAKNHLVNPSEIGKNLPLLPVITPKPKKPRGKVILNKGDLLEIKCEDKDSLMMNFIFDLGIDLEINLEEEKLIKFNSIKKPSDITNELTVITANKDSLLTSSQVVKVDIIEK
jgi:hypothetical protein